jgi:hypothetical protein
MPKGMTMANDLAPGWVQLNYVSNGHLHKAILPTSFSLTPTSGVEPTLNTRNGTGTLAGTCVTAYVGKLLAFFNTADLFTSYEVYHKPTPSSPPAFIWADNLNTAGTASTADTPANEGVFTFKTTTAGGLRLYLMENILGTNHKTPLPGTAGSPGALLTDYILGPSDWIIGRNNQFPMAGLWLTTKLNDSLRRKYLL